MRAEIERQALQNGWSINAEINRRLERSLQDLDIIQRYFGQPEALELLQPIAGIINHTMLLNKKSWKTDKQTREDIRNSINILLDLADDEEGFAAKRAAYERRAALERRAAEREGEKLPEEYRLPSLPIEPPPSAAEPATTKTLDEATLNAVAERAAEIVLERLGDPERKAA